MQNDRRMFFVLATTVAILFAPTLAAAENPKATVYKTPTCGCCSKWIKHLEENGIDVEAKDLRDVTPIKKISGVPRTMASCHTAMIDGYFIEGHVPAEDIKRLLKERPEVAGLAVPRMPIGSPGMEGPNAKPYRVYAVGTDGSAKVYATHNP